MLVLRGSGGVALSQDHRDRIATKLRLVEAELAEAEATKAREIAGLAQRIRAEDSIAAGELADVRDPLAVRGLRVCLEDESSVVRRGAVMALASIEGWPALHALVLAMANPDASVRKLARQSLAQRTGREFGDDRLAWDRWLRCEDPLLQRLGVQASLELDPVVAGRVTWRLENLRSEPRTLTAGDLTGELRVHGANGPLELSVSPTAPRALMLYPGEALTGSFDLPELSGAAWGPGRYRVEWRPWVTAAGEQHEVEASPVLVVID